MDWEHMGKYRKLWKYRKHMGWETIETGTWESIRRYGKLEETFENTGKCLDICENQHKYGSIGNK